MPVLDRFRLDGRTAVVTGASRGIGAAIAIGLAEAGADIVGVSRTLTLDGGRVGHEIRARGRSFTGYACDLADRRDVRALSEQLRDEYQTVDILVSNAGTVRRSPAASHSDEDWDLVMDTNLTSAFILARDLGRRMVERGAGKIIFTASLLAFQGGILVPAYAAAKGGIVQVAKALANEWAVHNVQVNAIAPGYIATDNNTALRNDPVRKATIDARIPAGRWGDPEDLVGAAVFLASEASDYVNGSVLVVDGGWLGR